MRIFSIQGFQLFDGAVDIVLTFEIGHDITMLRMAIFNKLDIEPAQARGDIHPSDNHSLICDTNSCCVLYFSRPVFIPGNVTSAALQFLRCTLHHLNPYKIMSALLLSSENSKMFKTIVIALTDFHELTSLQALLVGLEVKSYCR